MRGAVTVDTPVGGYGLLQPQLSDVRAQLATVFGPQADRIWVRLLSTAALTGTETDLEAVSRLCRAMLAAEHPVVALCGRGLGIRLATHEQLGPACGVDR